MERPGLSALREAAKRKQIDVVLIYSLSRLTRSVKGLGTLLEEFGRKGVRLASVSEGIDSTNPAGVLVLNILASVSQWEREENDRRTSVALQHKKSQGKVYSGEPPLDFAKVGDALQPIPPELDTVRLVFKLKGEGKSLRAVAQALVEAGRLTKRGGAWSNETVRKILRNREFYAPFIS